MPSFASSCQEGPHYLDHHVEELSLGTEHGLNVDKPVDEDIHHLVDLGPSAVRSIDS